MEILRPHSTAPELRRFHFADAFWFRVPLKALVLVVTVFALVSIAPSLTDGTTADHQRALFGLAVMLLFDAAAITVGVAINDSAVEVDGEHVYVRFEAFFHAAFPLADVISVRHIDPRPAWRYRFGFSTNFEDRIACSHGGPMVEVTLARPQTVRLWPRELRVTTFWLAVRETEAFVAALQPADAEYEEMPRAA